MRQRLSCDGGGSCLCRSSSTRAVKMLDQGTAKAVEFMHRRRKHEFRLHEKVGQALAARLLHTVWYWRTDRSY
jgi:hypothetical protein